MRFATTCAKHTINTPAEPGLTLDSRLLGVLMLLMLSAGFAWTKRGQPPARRLG